MTDPIAPVSEIKLPVLAHRIVQLGLFLTLVWKWTHFRASTGVYANIPLDDPFFPDWLRSVTTVSTAYLATVGAVVVSFGTGSQSLRSLCSWVALIGTTTLCLHQSSYNDMTFVTAWWVSLWTVWYVHRDWEVDRERLLRRSAFLSRLIISVILLGGAVGKWTDEYWSGEVLYDIYFRDRDFWVFNLMRASLEPEMLREVAMYYSRKVILLETVAGFGLWLLPARWAALVAMVVLTSIALFSNFLLFSVVSCLIGLAAVGLFVPRHGTSIEAAENLNRKLD